MHNRSIKPLIQSVRDDREVAAQQRDAEAEDANVERQQHQVKVRERRRARRTAGDAIAIAARVRKTCSSEAKMQERTESGEATSRKQPSQTCHYSG